MERFGGDLGDVIEYIVEAVVIFADMLVKGEGGVAKDATNARQVLKFWSDLQRDEEDYRGEGDLVLFQRYGWMWETGLGGEKDLEKAEEWYECNFYGGDESTKDDLRRVKIALGRELNSDLAMSDGE